MMMTVLVLMEYDINDDLILTMMTMTMSYDNDDNNDDDVR